MAAEITKIRGKRNVYYRHLENLDGEIHTLLKNFEFRDEDHIVKLNSLRSSYQKKVENVEALDDQIKTQFKEQEDMEELTETWKITSYMGNK